VNLPDGGNVNLKLRLLGTPEISLGETPIVETIPVKAQAILYYLAVTGQPQNRSTLAGLLWGDVPEAAARASLRKALSSLRPALATYLDLDGQTLAFKPESSYWVDVVEFKAGLTIKLSSETDIRRLQQAVDLYRADFLNGFSVRNAPDFETWLLSEQAYLRDLAIQTFGILASYCAEQGHIPQAIAYTRRLLALEPWWEEAHRQLMQLLAFAGQRGQALAQYESCRKLLADELGIEPSLETTTLYQRIRNDTLNQAEMQSQIQNPKAVLGKAEESKTQNQHNLPAQPTPFIGRRQELADITRHLKEPACRLLTLVGPGGIGKTRLAIQAAHIFINASPDETRFSHGLLFAPLASANSTNEIISAIAQAANLAFYDNISPRQQLLDYLREKEMLLILDNFEHLLAPLNQEGDQLATSLITEIMTVAPRIKILVTSRKALSLREEWFYPVAGMSFPPASKQSPSRETENNPAEMTSIESYDAVQLFTQSARRSRLGFSLAAEQQSVVRICQLVEGTPLGIELAAAWLKILPAEKIAQEIERNLDFLTSRIQNVPPRHRSMRAVFEYSWQLLSSDEGQVLRQLSVFRGGFRREAAEVVANGSLMTLATLVEKSLLQVTTNGRYQIHELLRQYVGEKLVAEPQQEVATRNRHSAYYLNFLQARQQALTGQSQQLALDEIGEEIENVRASWYWAVEQGNLEALDQALDTLHRFYWIRSWSQEGAELFAHTATRLKQAAGLARPPQLEAVLCKLTGRRGLFHYFLGDYETANHYFQKNLALAKKLDLQVEIAAALNTLGAIAIWQGRRALAQERLQQSLAIYREIGDQKGIADTLQELAQLAASYGDYPAGKRWAQESLVICHELGRLDWIAYALDTLGWTTFCLGDYSRADSYYRESLAIFEKIGHRLGIVLALGGVASVAWARGEAGFAEAQSYMNKSLALCREIGHRHHLSGRLWYLAQIANDMGDYDQAQRYAEEGLAIARQIGSSVFIAYNLSALGGAACGRGDLQTGRRHLLDVLKIAVEADLLPPLTIALFQFTLLLMKESALEGLSDQARLQKKAQAFKVLRQLILHPACWQVFKDRASRLQAEVEAQLPVEIVTTVQAQLKDHSLEQLVAKMMVEGRLTSI
jgi:predicted ATPase/DNA-binding SARP family transcriptional activator